ncbi:MAG: hypothetical protein JWM11_6692 [Planctomycetaceae bacterium]|nr:hypothetical protein [Planctomycetaceae bacterium]
MTHQRLTRWILNQRRLFLAGIIALFGQLAGIQSARADEPEKKPAVVAPAIPVEKLLPARTVFLMIDEGFETHQAAWDKTAASDALSKTGIFQIGQQFIDSYVNLLDTEETKGTGLKQTIGEVLGTLQGLTNKGYAVSVSLPEGKGVNWPHLTVVLPQGGAFTKTLLKLSTTKFWEEGVAMPASDENAEDAQCQATKETKEEPKKDEPKKEDQKPDQPAKVDTPEAADKMEVEESVWKKELIGGREIYQIGAESHGIEIPGFDVAFWEERGHFVFVIGLNAVKSTLTLADGKAPDITTNRIWKELHQGQRGFDRRGYGWIDVQELRVAFDDVPLNGEGLEGFGEQFLEMGGGLLEAFSEIIFLPFELFGLAQLDVVDVAQINPPEGVDFILPQEQPGLVAFVPDAVAPVAEEPKPVKEGAVPAEAAEAKFSLTVKQLLTVLGLETVKHYAWQSGYKGRALWSESFLSAPGPKRGLLGFSEQPSIRFDQLPPLPKDTVAFSATSVDLKTIRESSIQLIKSLGPTVSGIPVDKIEQEIQKWQKENGPLCEELVAGLDPLVCVYNDATNGPLSFGPVLVWKVKDAVRLRKGLESCVAILTAPSPKKAKEIAEKEAALKAVPEVQANVEPKAKADEKVVVKVVADVEKPAKKPAEAVDPADPDVKPDEAAPEVAVLSTELNLKAVRKTRYGRELVGLQIEDYPLGIAYTVDDNWLAISFNSQLLEAFLLRVDGKLPHWEPTAAHRDAMRDLPDQFTSISVDDPRTTLPALVSLGYCGLTWLEAIFQAEGALPKTKKVLADVPNLPPAELVIQPLFPNVTVTTVNDAGVHWYTRNSLPSVSFGSYVGGYVMLALFGEMGLPMMISF